MITDEERENIREQFAEAKFQAYLYGRAAERKAILKAAEALIADGNVPIRTIFNSLMAVLKKKVKYEDYDQMV